MDLHTLHIEHAALLGLFTLLTVVNSLLFRGARGGRWFPLFPFFAFLGAVLISLRGVVPNELSIFAGDLMFPLGYICLHRAITEFFGEGRSQWWLQVALAGGAAAILFRWGIETPDTQRRLFGYSLLLAAQVGMTAWFLLRRKVGPLRWSSRLLGGLLVLLSANNLFRAFVVLRQGVPQNYLHSGSTVSWTLLWTSVLQSAVIIGYVWMTAALLRSELEQEARIDPLTRVLNRRAIEAEAEQAITRSRRGGSPVSAILIDLDDFKQINDRWGHPSGDTVLREVALCLDRQMRADDRLARLGGDEFVVLLPSTSRHEAMGIAETLRGRIDSLRFDFGGDETGVRASFGAAQLDPEREWLHLIGCCDSALYRVKHRGGNRVMAH